MRHVRGRILAAFGVGVAAAGFLPGAVVLGQGGDAPAAPPATTDAHPLGGPRVESRPEARTLVRRAMGGELEALDQRPEAAAVELLDLSERERADVQRVLEARAALVSKVLSEHYDLVLRAQGLRQAMQEGGDRREAAGLLRDLREAVQPLLEPALRTQVAAVLNPSSRAEFERLVDEYMAALAQEGARGGDGSRPARRGARANGEEGAGAMGEGFARRRVEMVLVQREMGRALQGAVAMRQEQVAEFFKAIGATPEQEAKLRAIMQRGMRDAAAAGDDAPGDSARGERLRRILAELTPEQRRAALQHFRGR
jgi:hypothetical protein